MKSQSGSYKEDFCCPLCHIQTEVILGDKEDENISPAVFYFEFCKISVLSSYICTDNIDNNGNYYFLNKENWRCGFPSLLKPWE